MRASNFSIEVRRPGLQVLLVVRHAIEAYERCPPAGPTLVSPLIGLRHLCTMYFAGYERDARAFLPSLPADMSHSARPTPEQTPLYLVALEWLGGGTLWDRLKPAAVLPPLEQLLAAADMMAALMALHHLGFAHADLK